MDSYNEKNIKSVGWITWISVLVALLGGWLTHSQLFISVAFIPMGLSAIVFNRDLAIRDAGKWKQYKPNHKFFRGAYVFVGIAFIVISVITLVNR